MLTTFSSYAPRWTWAKRVGLLFLTIYCLFLFLSMNLFHISGILWNELVIYTGAHILHLPYAITIFPNGSGDTTYDYILRFLWIMLALVLAIIWAIADRKRNDYHRLYQWLRIAVRYYLAYMMLAYGFSKIIRLQFPFPGLYKLSEPFGNTTPMGLAWSFFGYSKAYNLFTGTTEVLAGALLFFRRTTLLGALLAMAVMTNIVALNLCYDIPVKLFSINLLCLSIFLIAHDANRLKTFFFQQAPTTQNPRWKKNTRLTLKGLFILFTIFACWQTSTLLKYREQGNAPLYGIYDIEQFSPAGTSFSSPEANAFRWRRLIITSPGSARIISISDSVTDATCQVDTLQRTIHFNTSYDDQFTLSYQTPDKDHLTFNGTIRGDSIHITTKRMDLNKFRLISRGFHWINETPYNE